MSPEKRLKAYAIKYAVRGWNEAVVFAENRDEAIRKFRAGETEWDATDDGGWTTSGGFSSVRRSPGDDPG